MLSLVDDARAIFEAAIRAVQADHMLEPARWQPLVRGGLEGRRVAVAGIGKASLAMAGVVEEQLGAALSGGAVVVPHGHPGTLPAFLPMPRRIDVLEAAHPVPATSSVRAARRILQVAQACGPLDLLLVLLSGGGTALCADFVEGVSLEDARLTFRLLLESGADIHEMNAVRKHISRIGGGRLAQAAHPAEVLALAVSDVVGDDLSVIASGPTVPDPTTFRDALEVLLRYGLREKTPRSVLAHLETGLSLLELETPKAGQVSFEHVRTELLATNRTALVAAAVEARSRGYATYTLAHDVTGEAREVGRRLAEEARAIEAAQPVCLLWGGETTVTVRGQGRGGRNQELALAAAVALEGSRRRIVFLSGGTDGRDGPTDAAGAWTTQRTARWAREAGYMPEYFLANNDAFTFFEAAGSLLRTGPTHTNVMDVQIALVLPD